MRIAEKEFSVIFGINIIRDRAESKLPLDLCEEVSVDGAAVSSC